MLVVCRGLTGPLRVRGTGVVYTDLGPALSAEIGRAVQPFGDRHRMERPGGWELLIEVTQADARRRAGQVAVALSIRATLRARTGQLYLAQTQRYCSETGSVRPEEAAPVFLGCMNTLGRELGGWLGGVSP